MRDPSGRLTTKPATRLVITATGSRPVAFAPGAGRGAEQDPGAGRGAVTQGMGRRGVQAGESQ